MSRLGMRESDGERLSRDGNAIQHLTQYGMHENFAVPVGPAPKRRRRGQLQRNEYHMEKPEPAKAFMCMEAGCPRTFSSRFKLVRHLLIHSGERRFECSDCGRRFHRKDHLKNHLQVHNPNKILHSCELCQKTYCSVLSYRKHLALHAAESGDLVCKLCGKVLADREGILHHLKVHTGSRTLRGPAERKYPCDQCDRSFFTKKDVKRHLVVHTGKRDFICRYCPQRFGRKDHLVRHTKKSHAGNSSPSLQNNEAMHKYEHPPHPNPHLSSSDHKNHNNNTLVVPPLSEMPGLVIPPTTVAPIMEHAVIDPIKPDPSYGVPPPNLVQSNYSLTPLSNENGQHLGRFPEPLLPVSQYYSMSNSYPNVAPITYSLSELLPPISMAPSFSSPLALDGNNPPLPHFNQAFQ